MNRQRLPTELATFLGGVRCPACGIARELGPVEVEVERRAACHFHVHMHCFRCSSDFAACIGTSVDDLEAVDIEGRLHEAITADEMLEVHEAMQAPDAWRRLLGGG